MKGAYVVQTLGPTLGACCLHKQGRGKVFYVGGAGGGGCSQFLRINITPNRNRKSCYSLHTFMRSC